MMNNDGDYHNQQSWLMTLRNRRPPDCLKACLRGLPPKMGVINTSGCPMNLQDKFLTTADSLPEATHRKSSAAKRCVGSGHSDFDLRFQVWLSPGWLRDFLWMRMVANLLIWWRHDGMHSKPLWRMVEADANTLVFYMDLCFSKCNRACISG